MIVGGQVFLVASSHVLEPDLGDPLGQSGQVGDAFQVLAVRIGIEKEIGLQDVKLFLGEGGAHAFRFASTASLRISFC